MSADEPTVCCTPGWHKLVCSGSGWCSDQGVACSVFAVVTLCSVLTAERVTTSPLMYILPDVCQLLQCCPVACCCAMAYAHANCCCTPSMPSLLLLSSLYSLLQVARGVTAEQIRGIFAPYGEIQDLNVMQPKKDGSMGEQEAYLDQQPILIPHYS